MLQYIIGIMRGFWESNLIYNVFGEIFRKDEVKTIVKKY